MMRKRVVVGMSGGIDSFMAALLLQQQGYEVIGVHLRLWKQAETSAVEDVCRRVGIPLFNREGYDLLQKAVVEPFMKDYEVGRTPSPCWECNRWVKWKLLLATANEYQAEFVATGHYVRIGVREGVYYIRKGVDPVKEQSYFLGGVTQDILRRAVTPLGDFTKTEIKALARKWGYEEVSRKKESMGVCFLEGRDYREFIRRQSKESYLPGLIYNRDGEVVGEHIGILNYTVGQRRGMPLIDGKPMYVAEIKPRENVIVADVKSGLWTYSLVVEQVVAACREDLQASDVTVRVRGIGQNPHGFVKIEEMTDGALRVELSEPAWAVAPGQPVVFYRGDWLVGGGIIRGNVN